MYGTIVLPTNHRSRLLGVRGVAAVVVVIVLVVFGFHSTALYTPAAVQPATQTIGLLPRTPVLASSSSTVAQPSVPAGNANTQVAYNLVTRSSILPFALGMTAFTALAAAFFLRRKPSPDMVMLSTSGERLVWFPSATPAPHLTGPGDRGFDPLGSPKSYDSIRISEVFHGRLAMLGVVGCILPEMTFHRPTDGDLKRAGGNRGWDWNGGECGDRSYPGFDQLGITSLAMLAMLGFEEKRFSTPVSPVENLRAHLIDPLSVNAISAIQHGSTAMFSTTGERDMWDEFVERAKKLLNRKDAEPDAMTYKVAAKLMEMEREKDTAVLLMEKEKDTAVLLKEKDFEKTQALALLRYQYLFLSSRFFYEELLHDVLRFAENSGWFIPAYCFREGRLVFTRFEQFLKGKKELWRRFVETTKITRVPFRSIVQGYYTLSSIVHQPPELYVIDLTGTESVAVPVDLRFFADIGHYYSQGRKTVKVSLVEIYAAMLKFPPPVQLEEEEVEEEKEVEEEEGAQAIAEPDET